jgi:aminocarboxymuconate-semialdehyde decarboxylase
MFTIDVHTHIIPREIPDFTSMFGRGEYIRLHHHEPGRAWMMKGETKFREIVSNCWDPPQRIQEMGQHQVDQQVICTIPVMFNYDKPVEDCATVSRFLNEDIIRTVAAHPSKFIGLGTVPMQNVPKAMAELEWCMQHGMKGVQIGTNINDENLGDEKFHPFFEACEKLNAAILIHPWQMMGQEHMTKYWLPWLVGMPAELSRAACSMIFAGVFEKYKNLRVCFAHGGGSFLPTISRIEHGWECRPDLVAIDNKKNPKSYLGKFWVDSHVCDHKMLQYVIDLLGADKVMQGSDYPFPLGEAVPGELVRNAPLSEENKKIVLGESAKAWLGLV